MKLTYTRLDAGRYQCNEVSEVTLVQHNSDGRWRAKHDGRRIAGIPITTTKRQLEGLVQAFHDERLVAAAPVTAPDASGVLRASIERHLREATDAVVASMRADLATAIEVPGADLTDLATAEAKLRDRIIRRVRYDVLVEISESIDAWVQQARENSEAGVGHRDDSEIFHRDDVRSVLADTARTLGLGDHWEAYVAGQTQ